MESNYSTFAFVYDNIMDTDLYEKWLSFTKRHIQKNQTNILELACGTGALAVEFSKNGYSVTGVDLSNEMLMMAYNRAVEVGCEKEITWVEADMMDLSEIETYDVVTCFSDSLCYLQDRQSVQQVFDEVYTTLVDDGVFLFDVHSTYQIDEVFPGYSYHENEEDFAFLWDSFEGEKEHSIVHELTFFVKDEETNTFMRHDEQHEERTYTIDQYLMMLESSGFYEVKVYADFTDDAPNETSVRW